MKTSSRRRVLVSSVSMLLVSMLALGTATFAWFTNNKNVIASGMEVKAAAAQGLQITGNNGGEWGPTYTFNKNNSLGTIVLQPVSASYTANGAYANFGTPYYPGEAKVEGPWTAEKDAHYLDWKSDATYPVADTSTSADAFGKTDYFAAYEVGVKSTTSEIENVKMTVKYDGAMAKDYIRVAVLKQGTEATNITGDSIVTVIGNDAAPNAISAISPVATTNQKLDATEVIVDVDNVKAEPQYYTVLVWYEGQDAQCIDSYQNAVGNIEIEFYY